MTRYVPTSGDAVAASLTAALWSLSRPPQARQPGDVTSALFGTQTMTDGSVWLCVDTELDVRVHAEAELDGIADILQPWIDDGLLPADTNTQLEALIESKRGDRLVVWEAFPQLFKDQSRTQTELEGLGLWPSLGL